MAVFENSPAVLTIVFLFIGLVALSNDKVEASEDGEIKETVCGLFGVGFTERIAFNIWRDLANTEVDDSASSEINGGVKSKDSYEAVSTETSDGLVLHGYRVFSSAEKSPTDRALLFLQGNARLARDYIPILEKISKYGVDVYIFDYRGYRDKKGVPLLKPISRDQQKVVEFLKNRDYKSLYLYAISMGGIFGFSPYMDISSFELIVVDSTPAELPTLAFCPSEYDPIANLPQDTSRIVVISGGQDKTVPPNQVRPFGEAVGDNGGVFLFEKDLGHPFDTRNGTRRRMEILSEFLENGDD